MPTTIRAVLPLLAGWACALLLACGGTAKTTCARAHDKLNECQSQIDAAVAQRGMRIPLTLADDCTGKYDECIAECVAPASCNAIVILLTGTATDPNAPVIDAPDAGTLGKCFNACLTQ